MGTSLASAQGSCQNFGNMDTRHPQAMTSMPFGNRMGHGLRIMEVLELSKEQREKIWHIRDNARSQIQIHRLSLFEGRKQLKEIINSDYDQNKVRKLVNEYRAAIAKLIMQRTETRMQIISVLTPEQRNQLKAFRGKGNMGLQRTTRSWLR